MATFAALLACATGPRDEFSGSWEATLPRGEGIVFRVEQHGSAIAGGAANCGPSSGTVTGSVVGKQLALDFSFAAGLPVPQASPIVPWSFHGAFASATEIDGTAISASGDTGSMVITLVSRHILPPCI